MTKAAIIKLIIFYSTQYGIDSQISLAVAQTESGFNPQAISETGDVGIFQIHEKSFPSYSKEQLLDPAINIQLGIEYLAKMKRECIYKENIEFLVCYNFGPENAKKVKHPKLWPYTRQVASLMELQ